MALLRSEEMIFARASKKEDLANVLHRDTEATFSEMHLSRVRKSPTDRDVTSDQRLEH